MKKTFICFLVSVLTISTLIIPTFAEMSSSEDVPICAPKADDKGYLVAENNYFVLENGKAVEINERTYSSSKMRGVVPGTKYYREISKSLAGYGSEKLDADFLVMSDNTVSCPRYYSSYSGTPPHRSPVETNMSTSSGRNSSQIYWYKINTDYVWYIISDFYKNTFSMSLGCDALGGA